MTSPFAREGDRLTPREEACIYLLAMCGCSTKQAARKLGIATGTVRVHLANAKQKAGVIGPVHRLVVWYLMDYDRKRHVERLELGEAA